MASDFLGALREVYDSVGGLPTLWSEVQPDQSVRTLPNAVLEDMGGTPTYDKAGERYVTAKARFTFYAASKAEAKGMGDSLVAALGVFSLAVNDKVPVLFRSRYQVPNSPRRGPKGEFMYVAMIDYTGYIGGVS